VKKALPIATTTAFAMLVLAPLAHAQMSGHGMNPEMRGKLAAACLGKASEAPCSFTRRDGQTVNGTCKSMRNQLLCMPEHRSMGGMHGGMGGRMIGPTGGTTMPLTAPWETNPS